MIASALSSAISTFAMLMMHKVLGHLMAITSLPSPPGITSNDDRGYCKQWSVIP